MGAVSVGFAPRRIIERPAWLQDDRVHRISSVAKCISPDVGGYGSDGARNALLLFDRWEDAYAASEIDDCDLLGFRVLPEAWDRGRAVPCDLPAVPAAEVPAGWRFLGYDAAGRSVGTAGGARVGFQHSPLSCNHRSGDFAVNEDALLDDVEEARRAAREFSGGGAEPGSYYVVEVWLGKP